ncbi:MAG TPA: group 1 truncated hemoglobin [Sphingomicrobium sp.]|jgi:hemoglobin|nr:group 1 truncated hemoglobin [Sphingomicrobium sp.]
MKSNPTNSVRESTGHAIESTRRDILQTAMLLSAAAVAATLPSTALASGQPAAAPAADKSLYERLGGIFAIAAVVDYFSDEVVKDPVAGARSKNPALREWHTKQLGRLPGLKFMRTLWVANISGGPFQYTPTRPGSTNLGLENAHENLRISPSEFDAVAGVLSRTLDHFSVPAREKGEVLSAFAAHKNEVTKGWRDAQAKAG